MNKRATLGLLAAGVWLLGAVGSAWAQSGPCLKVEAFVAANIKEFDNKFPEAYQAALQAAASPSCLGSVERDNNTLVQSFNAATPDVGTDAAKRYQATLAALDLLIKQARDRSVGEPKSAWTGMTTELASFRAGVERLGNAGDGAPFDDLLRGAIPKDVWGDGLVANDKGAVKLGDATELLLSAPNCTKLLCKEAADREELIRVVNLVGRLRKYLQADTLVAFAAELTRLDKQWTAYRDKARHQYIWEVFANGKLMGDRYCSGQGKDSTGNRRGFCAVPDWQLVLLHPETALTFNAKAGSASELQGNLMVEVLGYHRWNWAGTSGAELKDRFGVSLVSAYVKHGDKREWGWGFGVVAGDGYNLSVVRTPANKWSVLVNVALGDRYFGRKQEYVDYLKKVKKPDLSELF